MGQKCRTAVRTDSNGKSGFDDLSGLVETSIPNTGRDLNTGVMHAARVVVSTRQQKIRNLILVLQIRYKLVMDSIRKEELVPDVRQYFHPSQDERHQ